MPVLFTVAMLVSLLLHRPPLVESVRVNEAPTQALASPTIGLIVMPVVTTFTANVALLLQPPELTV
jgi:hypothetical protein